MAGQEEERRRGMSTAIYRIRLTLTLIQPHTNNQAAIKFYHCRKCQEDPMLKVAAHVMLSMEP